MQSTTHDSSHAGRPLTPVLAGTFLAIGFGPLLAAFFFNLWKFDTYQFFPLALAGAVLLLWRGLNEVERPLGYGSGWLTFPLVLAFLAVLSAAAVMWSPWLGAAAFLLALATGAWWLGGWPLWKAVFPAWLLFLTVLPPPLKLDARFALLLQEWATAGSSRVLAILGIPHFLSGLIIEIPGQRLLVEEACSGINSVLFMTSACVFYAMWQRRSLLFLGVLYAGTICCVLAGNLVRITSGAWLLFHYQIDLFHGWKHDALGLVLTGLYLGFIVVMDALLAALTTIHRQRRHAPEPNADKTPILEGVFFEGGVKFVAVLMVLLGGVQLLRGWQFHYGRETAQVVNPEWMDGSAKFTMPQELGGWRLVSDVLPVPKRAAFEDGVYSHIWQYAKGGMVVTVSLDYPFFNYHDVTVCYRGAGWEIGDRTLQRASAGNGMVPSMEVAMQKVGGINADLLFSTINESGVWLEEPGGGSPFGEDGSPLAEGGLMERLTHRLRQLPYADDSIDSAMNYRIQLLAAARGGLSTVQRRDVQRLFQEARAHLANQFVEVQPVVAATPDATERALRDAAKAAQEGVESAPDATERAVQEAIKAAREGAESMPDATDKAVREAVRSAQDSGGETLDATKRVIMEAVKEAQEAKSGGEKPSGDR